VVVLSATQKLLRFGVFELNLDSEELRRDGIPLKLPPQPFRILALLASHAGQLVTREEIQKQIWGDETFVDFEHGLNQCIKQVRTALNDNADHPVYVETVPRRGYRFLAPVVSKTVAAPPPQVVESKSGIQASPAALMGPVSVPPVQAAPLLLSGKRATSSGFESVGATAATVPAESTSASTTRRRIRLPAFLAAVCLLFVLVAVWLYWPTHKVTALTEKDTVVLADFANSTGDPVFDDTLKQALWVDLGQSPFLNFLSDSTVSDTLRLMERPPGDHVTLDTAREICLRNGSKAVLGGSISSLGSEYVIGLEAIACNSGETLAKEQTEAGRKEDVLKALDEAASSLRRKLGESLASVQKFEVPLEQATTPSLEALQAFSRGRTILLTNDGADVTSYFRRAVELDPSFARAYAALGVTYSHFSNDALAIQNLQRAYELRDRVSQRERFYIEATYYIFVTGELEKAIQSYTEWLQVYPGDSSPHSSLGAIYLALGRLDKAAEEYRKSLAASPNVAPYAALIVTYRGLNRLDLADAVLAQVQARKLDTPSLRSSRYSLAFLKGDNAAMQEQISWAMGKAGMEDRLLAAQSNTEAYSGRFIKARELSQRAAESAVRSGAPEMAAGWRAQEALREAEISNSTLARQIAKRVLASAPSRDVAPTAALALARAGDVANAEKLVTRLDQQFPLDTLMQDYSLPTIRAAIELGKNNPAAAIQSLQPTAGYELVTSYELGSQPFQWLYPTYLRGLAFLKIGQGQQAAAEFQKILEHRGIMMNWVTGPLAHLQLGRAQVMMGDKAAARKSYQDFLTLWEDADPDLPTLKQAKTEYAKLK
jgi:eukaryotic-like serine/threonine-protein kinase